MGQVGNRDLGKALAMVERVTRKRFEQVGHRQAAGHRQARRSGYGGNDSTPRCCIALRNPVSSKASSRRAEKYIEKEASMRCTAFRYTGATSNPTEQRLALLPADPWHCTGGAIRAFPTVPPRFGSAVDRRTDGGPPPDSTEKVQKPSKSTIEHMYT